MPKQRVALAVLAALGLATPLAVAGSRVQWGFNVSPAGGGYRYANGSFGDVRNHPDPGAYLECGSNNWPVGWCGVGLGTEQIWCHTSDPAKLAVIRAMSDGGTFSVGWDEQTMECTYVLQYTSSSATPKGP